jgi:hypothetical protein
VPAVLVGGGAHGEGACEGGVRGVLGARGGVAEAECECELRGVARIGLQRDLAGLEHVAIRRGVVVPVQLVISRQVRPAVAGANEAAGGAREARR